VLGSIVFPFMGPGRTHLPERDDNVQFVAQLTNYPLSAHAVRPLQSHKLNRLGSSDRLQEESETTTSDNHELEGPESFESRDYAPLNKLILKHTYFRTKLAKGHIVCRWQCSNNNINSSTARN
jgi:hypothetical protein